MWKFDMPLKSITQSIPAILFSIFPGTCAIILIDHYWYFLVLLQNIFSNGAVGFIYSVTIFVRSLPATKIRRKLFEAASLRRMYPDWVAGFDLIGQEDGGRSLLSIIKELKGFHLPFFFHAGETSK